MTQAFDPSSFLATVTNQPGVYRMYNTGAEVIYVGKAKDLKKRLSSYFRKTLDNEKTKALVSHIARIDVTVTHTETEALILEHNYIKQYMPKYNVLLRDDKSYPYILVSAHKHPRVSVYRGAKKKKGEYFGPYPDAGAVRETLHLIQKIFPVRQCEDSVYSHRTRPCLMYQIGRCAGPCVSDLISEQSYQELVDDLRLFLRGKDQQVVSMLVDRMTSASEALRFEDAAKYRDQIQAIRRIQEQQFVSADSLDDIDVLGFAQENGLACIHTLMIRQGKILGSRSFFPKIPGNTTHEEVFESFLKQYYLSHNESRTLPTKVIVNRGLLDDIQVFQLLLTEMAGRKVQFFVEPSGVRGRYLKLANTNAQTAITTRQNHRMTSLQRVKALQDELEMEQIQRMECFDISHTMGESTIASCVVFNQEGPVKQEYRRYNISGITGGDDYAAMGQVLERRYSKQIDVDKIPDIIFIDGGKGQLSRAHQIVSRYWDDWPKRPLLMGIAKGVTRKPGLETLLTVEGDEFHLANDAPALHLIQHIRDESHNHAISGHRNKRGKTRRTSALEGIEGIGPKRRQALLQFMGGLQELKRASVEEITKVPGISRSLAENIHQALKQ
ncbi:excinuclease ABC subunit UvrC [Vibrio spartinae]|uniref:UvrABC system protein C n=1 Tax=Vibrio spartinae TaxID=1918945 RepID=A0A1N6M6N5_9VIBR|nr:excinuclease ABC subunit UvrC [Vibrio spartinae]QMV14285.1 Excinuclease ABC subunit C [Vibrio spartinae]SIO95095.1 UvrABC system protein C [Vibrio spartinae]